jgi:hypothetical protein
MEPLVRSVIISAVIAAAISAGVITVYGYLFHSDTRSLHLVVRTVTGPSDPFPAGGFRGTSAFCENDEIVTGGGFFVSGPQSQAIITASSPVDEEHGTRLGWGTHGQNPTTIDGTIQAIVQCAKLVR